MKKLLSALVTTALLAGCAAAPEKLVNESMTPLTRVTTFTPPLVKVEVERVRLSEPPRPAPPPVLLKKPIRISMQVVFPFGGSRLSEKEKTALSEFSRLSLGVKNVSFTIRGYADSIGTKKENMLISSQRADAVSNVFLQSGIPADHLSVSGLGATDYVVQPTSCKGSYRAVQFCQAPNRRVTVEMTGVVETLVPGR